MSVTFQNDNSSARITRDEEAMAGDRAAFDELHGSGITNISSAAASSSPSTSPLYYGSSSGTGTPVAFRVSEGFWSAGQGPENFSEARERRARAVAQSGSCDLF